MTGSTNLWYIGVLLEIVSTMSGTIGKQLIRLSELLKKKTPSTSKLFFIVGIVVNTAVGPLIDLAAYSFAAQSLIAPFGGLDVVWNALSAPYVLGEKLTLGRGLGCLLVVTGTAVAGAFGNHDEEEYTLEYLEDLLIKPRVAFYFAGFFSWFALNRCFFMRFPVGSTIRGISLGTTAGSIAGNMFCVKASVELIQRSIQDRDASIWAHWLPYVMLLGALFFAVSNVGYMTKGLQEYEALFMVTIYEGSMIIAGCISGSIVLLDLQGLEPWRIALYFTGVVIICLGMFVIFREEAKNKSSLLSKLASVAEIANAKEHASISADLAKEMPLSPNKRCMHSTLDHDAEVTLHKHSSDFSRNFSGELHAQEGPETAPKDLEEGEPRGKPKESERRPSKGPSFSNIMKDVVSCVRICEADPTHGATVVKATPGLASRPSASTPRSPILGAPSESRDSRKVVL